MAKMLTESEFVTYIREWYPNGRFFEEELKEFFFGERKVIWLPCEDIEATEESEFAFDTLKSIVEGGRACPIWKKESKYGEEVYKLYGLTSKEVTTVWNVPFLSPVKEKVFGLVEIATPSLSDYLLFY